jgi:hypothetical protein
MNTLSLMSILVGGIIFTGTIYGQGNAPLRLVQKISMPNVEKRIDHMALDLEHKRLYVAALGNHTLEVCDLVQGRVVQSLAGLEEPQGVAFDPGTGRLFVSTGGDGKLHVFSGSPLRPISTLHLGDDADNVRYDPVAKRIYVGYGDGAIAAVDASTMKIFGTAEVTGHPESFQLEKSGPKIYVNVPSAKQVAVVDRVKQTVAARWLLAGLEANFPMALLEGEHRLLLATRKPAKLVVLNTISGKTIREVDCAGDADDLFYDAAKKLVYISCGEGVIDVFAVGDSDHYSEIARIKTSVGARTALWVPELNQFFLAVPRREGQEAAIWVYLRE